MISAPLPGGITTDRESVRAAALECAAACASRLWPGCLPKTVSACFISSAVSASDAGATSAPAAGGSAAVATHAIVHRTSWRRTVWDERRDSDMTVGVEVWRLRFRLVVVTRKPPDDSHARGHLRRARSRV